MGGKFVPPMAAVMADDVAGERKACLDLGCGSGKLVSLGVFLLRQSRT